MARRPCHPGFDGEGRVVASKVVDPKAKPWMTVYEADDGV